MSSNPALYQSTPLLTPIFGSTIITNTSTDSWSTITHSTNNANAKSAGSDKLPSTISSTAITAQGTSYTTFDATNETLETGTTDATRIFTTNYSNVLSTEKHVTTNEILGV